MWSVVWMILLRKRLKYSEYNLSQCHFIHHKFHMGWPGFELCPTQWGLEPTQSWHGPLLLLAFRAGDSWLTTARQISSIHVGVFGSFSHNVTHAGNHADIFIHMMKPIDSAAYCSPCKKFSHGIMVKCNSIDRNFVVLSCGYTLVHICWMCFSMWEIKILYCSFHVFSITISR